MGGLEKCPKIPFLAIFETPPPPHGGDRFFWFSLKLAKICIFRHMLLKTGFKNRFQAIFGHGAKTDFSLYNLVHSGTKKDPQGRPANFERFFENYFFPVQTRPSHNFWHPKLFAT